MLNNIFLHPLVKIGDFDILNIVSSLTGQNRILPHVRQRNLKLLIFNSFNMMRTEPFHSLSNNTLYWKESVLFIDEVSVTLLSLFFYALHCCCCSLGLCSFNGSEWLKFEEKSLIAYGNVQFNISRLCYNLWYFL